MEVKRAFRFKTYKQLYSKMKYSLDKMKRSLDSLDKMKR